MLVHMHGFVTPEWCRDETTTFIECSQKRRSLMAEIEVQINDTDPKTWNDLVSRSGPDIYNIYQTYEWAMLQKHANGYTPIFVRARDDSGVWGGQLYFKKRAFRFLPAYESLGGPLCTDGRIPEITELIIDHLRSNKWSSLYTKVRTGIFPELNGQFVQRGFVKWPVAFYLVDLTRTEEELWGGLHRSTKKTIHRSQNKGVVVEEAKSWDLWLDFHKMNQEHCLRKGIPSKSLAFFKEIYEQFVPKNMAKLFLAQYDGAVIAGELIFIYDKVISGYMAPSDIKYEKYSPNDVVMWNTLSWGSKNGFEILDLDDTWPDPASPFHGVHKFKEKWVGQVVQKDIYYQGKSYVFGRHLANRKRMMEKKYGLLTRNPQSA